METEDTSPFFCLSLSCFSPLNNDPSLDRPSVIFLEWFRSLCIFAFPQEVVEHSLQPFVWPENVPRHPFWTPHGLVADRLQVQFRKRNTYQRCWQHSLEKHVRFKKHCCLVWRFKIKSELYFPFVILTNFITPLATLHYLSNSILCLTSTAIEGGSFY